MVGQSTIRVGVSGGSKVVFEAESLMNASTDVSENSGCRRRKLDTAKEYLHGIKIQRINS